MRRPALRGRSCQGLEQHHYRTSSIYSDLTPVSDQLRVTQARVVLSEWIKFRSLRPTVYTLLAAVVLIIGLGALLSAVAASQPHGLDAGATAISTSLTGTFFAHLAIAVLGVLLITVSTAPG